VNKKRAAGLVAVAALGLAALTGCTGDAQVAGQNLTTAADQFELDRRIIFLNGITDKYIMSIEGRCSLENNATERKLTVICKVGQNPDVYKKHMLGTSDNVTWFMEQLEPAQVSTLHYRVTFKPETIIPDVRRP
jgi:hypothetical protein